MDPAAVAALFARLDRELWLVTARAGERRGGLIATFVSQASITPEEPRVLVGLARRHHTWELVEAGGSFGLHLLGPEHLDWVERFGLRSGRDLDKLDGLAVREGATGSPLVAGVLGWLDCRVEARLDTGDRTVYLAEVVAGGLDRSEPPLTVQRLRDRAPGPLLRALKEDLDRDGAADARAIREWRRARRPPLILASASPRRQQLLAEAGYPFEVDPSGLDEPAPAPGMAPGAYAAELAWRKAAAVAARRGRGLILAADTVCEVAGEILGKPADRADAERMIRLQEGRDCGVLTAVCLYRAEAHEWAGTVATSICRFAVLTDAERDAYLDSGRWQGKAGGYGVQDRDPFVRVVQGCWSNVVGLPMERLAELFRDHPGLV